MRWLSVVLGVVLLLASGADGMAQSATERVIVDATLWVNPPNAEGLCVGLAPGQIAISVKRATESVERRPASFKLRGFMEDPDTNVVIPISNQEVTVTTHVNGSSHYCWDVAVDAPETKDMSMANRGAYLQTIAVKITHTPN